MVASLPREEESLVGRPWSDIEPHYRDLEALPIDGGTVDAFLSGWNDVFTRVSETYMRLYIATTRDTADQAAARRFANFLDHVYTPFQEAEQRLKQKLLASGVRPEGFDVPWRKIEAEATLFRTENLPLLAEADKLRTEYDALVGAQTVEWQGRPIPIDQLKPVYQEPDRALREQAWRLEMDRRLVDRPAINQLWQQFLAVRQQLAANAGLSSYRDYRWRELLRFDYTPADCHLFHAAIEDVMVPAAQRIYESRRERLGVSTLRPWDLNVDPLSRSPLRPGDDVEDLTATTSAIFHRVNPQLGGYFDIMRREGFLDLESRPNKAPGGYCDALPATKRPFIFMNAVGIHDDVQTLLHEGGHAFHDFESSHLPYAQQRDYGTEIAEVASMSMELLASPYLAAGEGGFYTDAEAARARLEHLESLVLFWPYMAVVDAFQLWVYDNPTVAHDHWACDAQWLALWQRFMRGVDWSGLEDEAMTGWHRKLHIHTYPLYYVEYGLAQLGAVQVWALARKDAADAVARYRYALSLGGTRSMPELYAAAGIKFAFDAPTLRGALAVIEDSMASLDLQL